ncbi:thiamine phosphate synthase [Chelatococcus sp. GCM10030263]|uniref:thiamine phosphate synthase n=1 Tax=Chelatococcus sp. GCM10030263 TaxID=3273387 RepID=UPI00360CF979
MLPDPPLLVVSDRRQTDRPMEEVAAAAFAGGCRWFSLREKDLIRDAQISLALRIKALAAPYGARVMLHGEPDLAHAAGLDGIHLGAAGNAEAARALLGPNVFIGQSVHRVSEAGAAPAEALDYVIAGPAFLTASKPGYGPALGAEGLKAITAATSLPVIAIGGIAADTVETCRAAGVAGIAVMGGVMRADDPAGEVAALIAAWRG